MKKISHLQEPSAKWCTYLYGKVLYIILASDMIQGEQTRTEQGNRCCTSLQVPNP